MLRGVQAATTDSGVLTLAEREAVILDLRPNT